MSSPNKASDSSPSRNPSPSAREGPGGLTATPQDDNILHDPNLTTTRPSATETTETQDPTTNPNDRRSKITDDYEEQAGLYDFAEELHNCNPPVEPWFPEGTRLQRIHIHWLNKRLAMCRKDIIERQQPSDNDMEELGKVLHLQAEAARDLQVIRSLDFLTSAEQEVLHQRTVHYFPKTAASILPDVEPFASENYRRPPPEQVIVISHVGEFLRRILPKQISWSKDEKLSRKELYDRGIYMPQRLSNTADRLARFIVAMGLATFILVPMYIMALRQNPAKNLVTTTVAVVLFVFLCSVLLKLPHDQMLSLTVGYAAVLMVFVGLTSMPS